MKSERGEVRTPRYGQDENIICRHRGVFMHELTISITEMRSHFDEYLQRIKSGETIITKYGKPIAQFTPTQEVSDEKRLPCPKARKTQNERLDLLIVGLCGEAIAAQVPESLIKEVKNS